jgi:WXXGXW repeat (2 copies)
MIDRSRWTSIRVGTIGLATVVMIACLPVGPVGIVLVPRRPPPARVEVRGVAPGPGYTWIAGYWGWRNDDFYWVSGRWTRPEPGRSRWEHGRWVHARGGWYWREGHWH